MSVRKKFHLIFVIHWTLCFRFGRCKNIQHRPRTLNAKTTNTSLYLPVIKSVMAKLKTSVLYGVFSMDRFFKITTNNKALFKMANVPMTPNATLRPEGILREKKAYILFLGHSTDILQSNTGFYRDSVCCSYVGIICDICHQDVTVRQISLISTSSSILNLLFHFPFCLLLIPSGFSSRAWIKRHFKHVALSIIINPISLWESCVVGGFLRSKWLQKKISVANRANSLKLFAF